MTHRAHTLGERLDRLNGFANLPIGWCQGTGVPATPGAVTAARALLETLDAQHLPLPALFATPTGSINAEWYLSAPNNVTTVEFNPCGTTADAYSVTLSTNQQWHLPGQPVADLTNKIVSHLTGLTRTSTR